MSKKDVTLVKRYGKAAFSNFIESGNLPKVLEQIEQIDAIVKDDLMGFFDSPVHSLKDKKAALETLKNSEVDEHLYGLLNVLVENQRFSLMKEILKYITECSDELQNVLRGTLVSYEVCEEDVLKEIKEEIEKTYKKNLILHSQVDPSLKAGFVVKVGDTTVDASLKTRLMRLKEELMS
jgi:F-type H+-transporting ATPase subunit delta